MDTSDEYEFITDIRKHRQVLHSGDILQILSLNKRLPHGDICARHEHVSVKDARADAMLLEKRIRVDHDGRPKNRTRKLGACLSAQLVLRSYETCCNAGRLRWGNKLAFVRLPLSRGYSHFRVFHANTRTRAFVETSQPVR